MAIRRYGLGKFDTKIDSYLYSASLDGGPDEECGDSSMGPGWAGLMLGGLYDAVARVAKEEGDKLTDEEVELLKTSGGAVLYESTDGFVSVDYYDTEKQARDAYDDLCEDLELEDPDEDDDLDDEDPEDEDEDD